METLGKTSLLVQVHDNRYDLYATPNIRTRILKKVLERMGGINETVPDGWYEFKIKRSRFAIVASLLPVK